MSAHHRVVARPCHRTTRILRRATALGVAGLLALAVTACGEEATAGPSGTTSSTDTHAQGSQGGDLRLADGWVKATSAKMTGAFGVLTNTTGAPVHVVSATTSAAARVELHETRKDSGGAMVMQEAADGFTVPAGGTLRLEPGGNHLMLMGVSRPLAHGTTTAVTLAAEDGRSWTVELAVRDFAGANETYVPSSGH
jgi:copper(I)-binding protein